MVQRSYPDDRLAVCADDGMGNYGRHLLAAPLFYKLLRWRGLAAVER